MRHKDEKGRNEMKIQTIKETVRGAQDILARMALCQYIRDIQDQVADANESLPASSYHLNNPETGATFWTPFSSKSPGPEQSLGELCIELVQDACLKGGYLERPPVFISGDVDELPDLNLKITNLDIQDLRRAMYHRAGDRRDSRESRGQTGKPGN